MYNYIGVDPGKNGAIAVVYPDGIKVIPMPIVDKEIDAHAIIGFVPFDDSIVYIEKVWRPFKLIYMTGIIEGIFMSLEIQVNKVAPSTWRKKVLKNYRATKSDAIIYCNKTYPQLQLGFNHNLAEAVCIAEYGRLTLTSQK